MSADIRFSSISLKKDGRCGFTSSYQTKVKLKCLRHGHCHLVLMMSFATRVCVAGIVNVKQNHLLIFGVLHENQLTHSSDRANKKLTLLTFFFYCRLAVVIPMPVPAGATSLEKSSRAFFCLWWTANQSTASLQPCRQTDRQSYTCIHKAVGNIYFVIQEVHTVWSGQVNNVTNLILRVISSKWMQI